MGFAFSSWAQPNMPIEGKDGRTYSCPPPSVEQGKSILALAVVAEHRHGLATGELDPEMDKLAKSVTEDLAILTLGRVVRDQMIADGLSEMTIARAGYYGMWFWAVNEAFADWICGQMWSATPVDEVTDTAPKAPKRSKSGRSTASANRTRTASTRTTASPPT